MITRQNVFCVYLRVSSTPQDDTSKYHTSKVLQYEEIVEYIAREYKCSPDHIRDNICAFHDTGSAFRNKKPLKGWNALMEQSGDIDGKGKRFNTIFVYDVSRFSRNGKVGHETLEILDRKGINIYSVSQRCGYIEPHDRYKFRSLLNESIYFSEGLSHRTKTNIEKMKKSGNYIARVAVPYGKQYKIVDDKKTTELEPNQQEIDIVNKIKSLFTTGYNKKDIMRYLDDHKLYIRKRPWINKGLGNYAKLNKCINLKFDADSSSSISDMDIEDRTTKKSLKRRRK